ncbi:MAG: hypothetical protein EBU51_03295, partial [Synechococcaceae bacterium WB6_3A_227]|nr:hypothetical protein [Synechococcaceae bacterium WB6_3A_227]
NGTQANITSVGTLTSLSVSGTISAAGQVSGGSFNLGSINNITITGGTSGYVLSTNGSGVLSWAAPGGGGGGENPNVISITSATSAYATANGTITTNRLTGKYNAINTGAPFYWNYTNANSLATTPSLTDAINIQQLVQTTTGLAAANVFGSSKGPKGTRCF